MTIAPASPLRLAWRDPASLIATWFGFGLIPCELCLIQRIPHALAILIAFALSPLVELLRRIRFGRVFSVLVSVLLAGRVAAPSVAATRLPRISFFMVDDLLARYNA